MNKQAQCNNAAKEAARNAEEYYEKLGSLLSVLDQYDEIEEGDRAALVWAARDYHKLLGEAMGNLTAPQK